MSISIDTTLLNPKEYPDAIQINLLIIARDFAKAIEMLPKLSNSQLAELLHVSENPTPAQAEDEYFSLKGESADVKEYWNNRQKIETVRAKALELLKERIAKLEALQPAKDHVEGLQQEAAERTDAVLEGVGETAGVSERPCGD